MHSACFNLCPDEKGTEISGDLMGVLKVIDSFNLCPDEKGTESLTLSHLRLPPIVVSTFAPTKRGLKVSNMLDLQPSSRIVSTLAPMKRGLKDDFSVPYRDTTNGFNPCPDEKGTESCNDEAKERIEGLKRAKFHDARGAARRSASKALEALEIIFEALPLTLAKATPKTLEDFKKIPSRDIRRLLDRFQFVPRRKGD